jgi:hypothetical protein
MPSNDPHLEDDILVSREKIIEMFDPPPGRSTFFEWVNKGTVVKARGLTAYFLLNATRKKVKLPPVDVAAYRSQIASPANRKRQVHFTALFMLVPDIVEIFSDIEVPEALTLEEYRRIQHLMAMYGPELDLIEDPVGRIKFCRGALDMEALESPSIK